MSNHPQKSGSLCSGMSGSLCSGIGGSLYPGIGGSLYSGILILVSFCKFLLMSYTTTFSGLAKVAIFTTNVDAVNHTLINHKCVCGALNRHFCQTRVTSCPFFCHYFKVLLFLSVLNTQTLCRNFYLVSYGQSQSLLE